MREGVESGARLVEPDMPVGADAQHLHVLFHPFEQGVVAAALRVEVGGGAVGVPAVLAAVLGALIVGALLVVLVKVRSRKY